MVYCHRCDWIIYENGTRSRQDWNVESVTDDHAAASIYSNYYYAGVLYCC